MSIFLAIQHTYETIEWGLYQGTSQLSYHSISKMVASSKLLPALSDMFAAHNIKLTDILYIATNQGPGPFTTLRVVISTLNGISFVRKTPLVGVDGLAASLEEFDQKQPDTMTLVAYNAFNGDIYYGYRYQDIEHSGCLSVTNLLQYLSLEYPGVSIYAAGNGVHLYESVFKEQLGARLNIANPLPLFCSLDSIATQSISLWKDKQYTHQLLPLYLKQYSTPTKSLIS